MKEIGKYFEEMRASISFTQIQMAEELDVHPATYRRWEWGKCIPNEDIEFIIDCVKTVVERKKKKLAA